MSREWRPSRLKLGSGGPAASNLVIPGKRSATRDPCLTVSGSASSFFEHEERSLLEVLKRRSPGTTLQRFDLEGGQVQFRASLSLRGLEETTQLMAELQTKLPGYHISYMNLESLA